MTTNTTTFQPQLTPAELAAMIDREGLAFECRASEAHPWKTPRKCDSDALHYLRSAYEIRLAPGALTEFGLKPGLKPHNPDNLPADNITDGGKYRAVVAGDSCIHPHEFWSSRRNRWITGTQIDECVFGGMSSYSYRVPINTPFPTTPPTTEPESETLRLDAALAFLKKKNEHSHPDLAGYSVTGIQRLINDARQLETELRVTQCENQDYLDTFQAIYNKLGIKEGDAPGSEKVSDTVLRYVTATQRKLNEANGLLERAREDLKQALRQWSNLYDMANFDDDIALEDAEHLEAQIYKKAESTLTAITQHQAL